jgi:hypothetical protein
MRESGLARNLSMGRSTTRFDRRMSMSVSRRLALTLAVLVTVFMLIQLVPYGRDHSNPPAGTLAAWDTPGTGELARRACFDCHSNQTKWPWYASIAPISWRIQTHVNEGREKLNFTAFDPGSEDVAEAAGEAGETVTKGEMPPADYLLMHPEARLTAQEKRALVQGLNTTFAAFVESGEGARRSDGSPAMVGVAAREGRPDAREHAGAEERENEGREDYD